LAGRPGGAINCNKYRDPNVRNLCKTVQKAYDDAFICPNLPADGGLAAQPTGTPFDNIACMQKRDEIVERLKELNERYQKDKKQRDDLANKALKYANQFCNWNCPDGTIQDCCFKWTRFYTQVTCQQAYDYRSGQSPPDGTKRQCPDNDKLITASLIIQALILALQSIDCTKPVDWDKIETSLGTIALSLQQFENSMYYFLRDNGYLNMQQPWEQSCNTAWDTKHVCQPGWYCLDFVAGGCGCAYFDDYPPGDATYVVASGPWGDEASCQVACACGGGYYGG
jgi:hypothetical protein